MKVNYIKWIFIISLEGEDEFKNPTAQQIYDV